MNTATASAPGRQLAINRLRSQRPLTPATIDRFLAAHDVPIIEGEHATFLFRGEADEVELRHGVVGVPGRLPLRRIARTDLWFLVMTLPAGSRVEYRIAFRRGDTHHDVDDPLNPRRAHNPFGSNAVCHGVGYQTPTWTLPDPAAPPGRIEEMTLPSKALGRECAVTLYLPAGMLDTGGHPLLVVHDGGDYLTYSAAKHVLDNLIHRNEVTEVVAAFLHPSDRLVEYADDERHARFVSEELVPHLERELPLAGQREGRCLMGASFGAVASLATAWRYPEAYGSLVVQSGSFVFADEGADHGGGPVFDPVVDFVNRYRASPRRVADRVFVSCGAYEPLIGPNREMVPVLEATGMDVRFVEALDGHNWENWRDRLRAALTWVYPGPNGPDDLD